MTYDLQDKKWVERYSRQLVLKGWSSDKQNKLAKLTVYVPDELPAALLYLAAAGIGRLIYNRKIPLIEHIKQFNSATQITSAQENLSKVNIDVSLVVDGSTAMNAKIVELNNKISVVIHSSNNNYLAAATLAACTVISIVDLEHRVDFQSS